MARRPRVASDTGVYHVLLRGISGQKIFRDDEDYTRFIELLYRMVYPVDADKKALPSRCTFYAYCLMSDHVHLLIRDASENLSLVMKRITISYFQYYHKKYEYSGRVFYDRFSSEPVNDNAYFFTLIRYIHQKPITAGITKDIGGYQWSSWGEYERAGNGNPTVCNTQTILSKMTLANLRAYVKSPMSQVAKVIDCKYGRLSKTDQEVLDFLASNFHLKNPTDLQNYTDDRCGRVLRYAKTFGASIRQLVRLTGISFYRIRNA